MQDEYYQLSRDLHHELMQKTHKLRSYSKCLFTSLTNAEDDNALGVNMPNRWEMAEQVQVIIEATNLLEKELDKLSNQ